MSHKKRGCGVVAFVASAGPMTRANVVMQR